MAITTLDGKKCLITGAGSGIGHATALAAAAEGAELFLTDINEVGLAHTVEQVGNQGGTVSFSRALDVSDYDAVTAFAADIHDQFGSLDVVMNVAGISAWGTVENLEHRHWKSMIDVNLMGPVVTLSTCPLLRDCWRCPGMPLTAQANSGSAGCPRFCDST
jgi:NAD(P)-dependent dehydrogenase (short-subunit alcohol dehydrogenase family)